jgi:hypothetical protein
VFSRQNFSSPVVVQVTETKMQRNCVFSRQIMKLFSRQNMKLFFRQKLILFVGIVLATESLQAWLPGWRFTLLLGDTECNSAQEANSQIIQPMD